MSNRNQKSSMGDFFSGSAGSIIGGIGGLIGGIFNNRAIAKENQKNRDFAHDEAVLAHERQLELMDKTNDWNSFVNQRKLAEEAGLNPWNLFSNGASGISRSNGATGGAQASNPSVGMPQNVMSPSVIQALADANLKRAQADNLDEQGNKYKKEQGFIVEQTALTGLQKTWQKFTNDILEQYGMKQAAAQLGLTNSQWNKADADALFQDTMRKYYNRLDEINFWKWNIEQPLYGAKLGSDILVQTALADHYTSSSNLTKKEIGAFEKRLGLQLTIGSAYIRNLNASSFKLQMEGEYTRTQNSLWQPGGLLYQNKLAQTGNLFSSSALNNAKRDQLNWYTSKDKQQWSAFGTEYMQAMKENFRLQLTNYSRENNYNSSFVGKTLYYFDRFTTDFSKVQGNMDDIIDSKINPKWQTNLLNKFKTASQTVEPFIP